LQPEQLVRFNECLENETHVDLKDFLILEMTTGARKSDLFSMRWEDWHRERQLWTVPFPKNGESYDVSLLPSAVEVLERRHAEALNSAVWVFPGVGKSGHLMELRKPWDAFRKRAAITDIRVHDLRRTVGSYLAISGTPLQQIAAALGHKSMQSTLVYARLQYEAIRDARETGQAKMLEMMDAAKKRMKLASKKQNFLTDRTVRQAADRA
jgi:integrase